MACSWWPGGTTCGALLGARDVHCTIAGSTGVCLCVPNLNVRSRQARPGEEATDLGSQRSKVQEAVWSESKQELT